VSATFDASLVDAKDRVRLLLGDVPDGAVSGEVADAMLQDETIDAMLGKYSYNEACRHLAISLISRFSAEPDKYEEGNGKRLEWRSRLDGWKAILREVKTVESPTRNRSGISVGKLTNPAMTNMRTD